MKVNIPSEILDNYPHEKIFYDEPMSNITQIKTGGNAAAFISPSTVDELCFLIKALRTRRNFFIMGNGTNIIVSDNGYKGIAISTKKIKKIYTYGDYMTVYAGNSLTEVSEAAIKVGLTGAEWACAIAGTLGGAISMNTKMFGTEICELLYAVEVLTKEGDLLTLKADDINMRIQKTDIKEKNYTVCRAILRLFKGDRPLIKETTENYAKQAESGNISMDGHTSQIFTDPNNYGETARIIAECGLAGYVRGGAQVCKSNPNKIINKGNATSQDIHELVSHIILVVLEKRKIQLKLKIKFIGNFGR